MYVPLQVYTCWLVTYRGSGRKKSCIYAENRLYKGNFTKNDPTLKIKTYISASLAY